MRKESSYHWMCHLLIVIGMAGSLSACSGVYLIENTSDYRFITTESRLETRDTSKLARRGEPELQVTVDLLDLKASIMDKAYYHTEQREIKQKSNRPLFNALALVESGIWLGGISGILRVYYVKTGVEHEGETIVPSWLWWVMWWVTGATSIDFGFLLIEDMIIHPPTNGSLTPFSDQSWETKISTTPWKPGKEVRAGNPIPRKIANHPMSFVIPKFNWQKSYSTDVTGVVKIPLSDLTTTVSSIPDPADVLDVGSIAVNVSTEIDGKTLKKSAMLASFDTLQAFRDAARQEQRHRQEAPADLVTEVAFSDEADFIPNQSLDAGEWSGELKVTVRNQGKGIGFDVQLQLHSDNPDVKLDTTKSLGDIAFNEEKTVTFPVETNLQVKDGFVNIVVETKEKRGFDAQKQQIRIPVVHLDAPKLEIASIELNDRKLGRAQGNGNGIPENDETIELIAYIKNNGVGDAIAAKLELVEINSGLSVLERAMDFGTIRPNQTVKGTLLFHVPRTFIAEQLKYQLRVSEIRGVGTAEKAETIAMSVRQPILAYLIKPPDVLHNGEKVAFELIPKNQGLLDAKGVNIRLSAPGASINPETFAIGDLPAGITSLARRVVVDLPRTYSQKQLTLQIQMTQSDFPAKSGAETYPVELLAPEFTVTDRFADQNGNQVIEQGERVEVELTLTNRGRLEAQNVKVSVSTSIPDVQVAETQKLVGTLPPNATSNPVKFIFTLPRAGESGDFPITVTINQSDFASVTPRLKYTIAPASPILGVTAQFVDEDKDGRIEQGENVDVAVTVTNTGKQDALNAEVQLSTTIPNVVIAKKNQSIGTLSPNKSETVKFPVTIPRGVPTGALPFEVKVTHAEFAPVVKALNYTIYEAGVATTVVEAKKPSETPQPEAFRGNQPPTILPTNVTDNQTVYTANFVLQASVLDDRSISSVTVSLNSARVYDSQTDSTVADKLRASDGKLLNFDQNVTLQAGVNDLVFVARDSDNESKQVKLQITYKRPTSAIAELDNPSDVDVEIPTTGMSNPDAIAVVIGNRDYLHFPPVNYAIRDAQAMREYLIKMLGYRPENVILIENATKGRFDELFGIPGVPEGELYNRVKQGISDVFIFYSGHGLPALKGQQHGYIVPIDCQEKNFRFSGYAMETFYQNVNQIPARSITIVLDACFSGKSIGGNLITGVSGGPGTMTSPIYKDSDKPLLRSDVLIFASANGDEWSNWHSEKRHGLFTYFFLKGLRGDADGNGDKNILASELDRYIGNESTGVPYHARIAGKPQTPVIMGDTAKIVVRLK